MHIKILFAAPTFVSVLFLLSCKEKSIEIPSASVGNRKVLAEEVTGVDCPQCPGGAMALANLSKTYGDNLVVVAIHAGARGSFNKQLPGAVYNFNTNQLEELVPVIGAPEGFPYCAVNRQEVNNDPAIFYPEPWGGLVAQELGQDFGLFLSVENTFDPTSRALDMDVRIAAGNALSGEHRLSIYLVQDSIIDPQNVFGTLTPAYVHRHVLRFVVTNVSGDVLEEALDAGTVLNKRYTYTLPTNFDVEHGSVVAFIHHSGVPDKEVLQVVEKRMIE